MSSAEAAEEIVAEVPDAAAEEAVAALTATIFCAASLRWVNDNNNALSLLLSLLSSFFDFAVTTAVVVVAFTFFNIEAKEVRVGGQVTGNIKVKGYLELTSTARIFGDIETSEISIERGAVINGKINMVKEVKDQDKK